MNKLFDQLKEAQRMDDQGMVALIQTQIFYLLCEE